MMMMMLTIAVIWLLAAVAVLAWFVSRLRNSLDLALSNTEQAIALSSATQRQADELEDVTDERFDAVWAELEKKAKSRRSRAKVVDVVVSEEN